MSTADHTSKRALRSGLLSAAVVLAFIGHHGMAISQAAAESAAMRSAASAQVRPAAAGAANAARPAAPVSAAVAAAARGAPAAQGATGAGDGRAMTPPDVDQGPTCVGGLPQPTQVRMNVGKSTLLNLPEPAVRRTLGDPEVVDARMVSPQVMYLVSGRVGSTNAIIQGTSGRCLVLDIAVGIDTDVIQAKLAELLPGERGIRVIAAADSVVLTGTVSDAVAAERAVAIANAYLRSPYQQGLIKGGTSPTAGLAVQQAIAGGAALMARVVNLLTVGSPQQVMLEVKIAEVSKTLLNQLGVGFNASRTNGSWSYQILSGFLSGTAAGTAGLVKNPINNLTLEAEKKDGLVRMLAEPTVMAISGQEGSFLAGGKILIPVAQASSTGMLVTLEEKEFGVGLRFTPTVLGDGRINLRVAPEVSEISSQGVGISASGINGSSVLPLITTRRASTTVQLFDGQSFAIGGLIRNSGSATIRAFPVLGEIPVIGALFRSTNFQDEKSELVFIVTPRLVKPLPPGYTLPTDRVDLPTLRSLTVDGRVDAQAGGDGAAAPRAAAPRAAEPPKAGGLELK